MLKKPQNETALSRIEAARHGLIDRGYRCLSSGKFGLPSYDKIEAWGKAGVVLYLVYEQGEGGWDILTQLDSTNSVENTWREVDKIDFVGIGSKGGA